MDRRELLKTIAVLTGGAVVGGEFFLSGCTSGAGSAASVFTPATIALLDEIAETIIPATNTPGAKAAAVGSFMKVMVTDCYTDEEQKVFSDGISNLQDICRKMYNETFLNCTPQQRHDLLVTLEKEAKAYNTKKQESEKEAKEVAKASKVPFTEAPPHYYTMMKQLTLWGFFTSKTGMTETLRHIPVPGRYDGALPYKKGDKAWAE